MFDINRWAPYIRVPIRYGLYAGGISFIFMVLLYHMGYHPMLIPPYFDYRIPLLATVIFFSLKEARDHYGMKQFFFWQGMAGGGILTGCFILVVFICLYGYMIVNAEFLHSYITLSLTQLKSFSEQDINHVGRANYEEGIQLLKHVTIIDVLRLRSLQSFIISSFVSIIIAIILRKSSDKST